MNRNEADGHEASISRDTILPGRVGASLVGMGTPPSRLAGASGQKFPGGPVNLVSSDSGRSAPGRPGEAQSDNDIAATPSAAAVGGELWLDTLSLRDWLQNYLTGEIGRASLGANRSGNSLTYS
jgi:hypothetical protein